MGKVFELVIEDENDLITAISLVEKPAIEEDFMYFSKSEIQFAQTNNEKRMLVGPILIPDKQILRVDEVDGTPYHVYFSKETVAKLAQNYLKSKLIDSATLEHDKKIKGVHLVESWIKEGKLDKSNSYGMNMPEGTWMGKFYIDESKEGNTIWNDYIKTGRVKGFSVEALMEHKLVKASAHIDLFEKSIEELSDDEASIVLAKIKQMLESYTDYPESVSNNAKRALAWAEENGWGDCGESTGKQRANQLANREPISRDTIARMASFKRHQQNKDVPYSEGCGGLMWDAWGGTSGVEWAINKLKEIDMEAIPSISSSYPGEVASGSVAPALL